MWVLYDSVFLCEYVRVHMYAMYIACVCFEVQYIQCSRVCLHVYCTCMFWYLQVNVRIHCTFTLGHEHFLLVYFIIVQYVHIFFKLWSMGKKSNSRIAMISITIKTIITVTP